MKKVSLMALMLVAGANVNAANYYVGGKIGYTSLQMIGYNNDEVRTETDKKASEFDYSVAVGVKADDVRFEAEIESMTFAEIKKDELKTKSISLMSNVYYDVNLQKLAGVANVKPYVSAGIGVYHMDSQSYNTSKEWEMDKSSLVKKPLWSVGAGVSYEVMPMVTVDAGYKYQRIFADPISDDGKTFTKQTKHSAMFGARYNF